MMKPQHHAITPALVVLFIITILITTLATAQITVDYIPTAIADDYGIYFKTTITCNNATAPPEQPVIRCDNINSNFKFSLVDKKISQDTRKPIPWNVYAVNHTLFDHNNKLYHHQDEGTADFNGVALEDQHMVYATNFYPTNLNTPIPQGEEVVLHGFGFIRTFTNHEADLFNDYLITLRFDYQQDDAVVASDTTDVEWFYKHRNAKLSIQEEFLTIDKAQQHQYNLQLFLESPSAAIGKIELSFHGMLQFKADHEISCLVNGVVDLPLRFVPKHGDQPNFGKKTAFEVSLDLTESAMSGYPTPYFERATDIYLVCTGFTIEMPLETIWETKLLSVSAALYPLNTDEHRVPHVQTFGYDAINFRLFTFYNPATQQMETYHPKNFKMLSNDQLMLTAPVALKKEDRRYETHQHVDYYSDLLFTATLQDGMLFLDTNELATLKNNNNDNNNNQLNIPVPDPISFKDWPESYVLEIVWKSQKHMELDLSYTLTQNINILFYNTTSKSYVHFDHNNLLSNGTLVFPKVTNGNKIQNALKSKEFQLKLPQQYEIYQNLTQLVDYDPTHPIKINYQVFLTFDMRLFYDFNSYGYYNKQAKPNQDQGEFTPTIFLHKHHTEYFHTTAYTRAISLNDTLAYSHGVYTEPLAMTLPQKGHGFTMQRTKGKAGDKVQHFGFELEFSFPDQAKFNQFRISLEGQEQYLFSPDATTKCVLNGDMAVQLYDETYTKLPYHTHPLVDNTINITSYFPYPEFGAIILGFPNTLQKHQQYKLICSGRFIVPTKLHTGHYETNYDRFDMFLIPSFRTALAAPPASISEHDFFDAMLEQYELEAKGEQYMIKLPMYFGSVVIRRLSSFVIAIMAIFLVSLIIGAIVVVLLRCLNKYVYADRQKAKEERIYAQHRASRIGVNVGGDDGEAEYEQLQ